MTDDRNFPHHYILVDKVAFAVDLMTWANWFEKPDNRRVARTDIDRDLGVFVSTVFMGLDHNWGERGDPVLFETMAFGPSDMMLFGRRIEQDELSQRRYCTWAQAEAGHAEVVAETTAWLDRIRQQTATALSSQSKATP